MRADENPWAAWRAAVATPTVDADIRRLYADLDAAVQQRGPTCWTSGKCCNFDAYGHRLYVTGLEIAWVLEQVSGLAEHNGRGGEGVKGGAGVALPLLNRSTDQPLNPSCAFQRDKLCTIHAVRPMGCRVFFCQAGTQDWQGELYETYLARLRALHDAHDQPYRYMEWRAGLRQAMDAASGC